MEAVLNLDNKRKETINKLIDSGIQLFGERGFSGGSITAIAQNAGVSKGIMYHYFKNKEELYLKCMEVCFNDYINYMEENIEKNKGKNTDFRQSFENHLMLRNDFFQEHPFHKKLFDYSIVQKPEHLVKEIQNLRKPLIATNIKFFEEALAHIEKGKGVTTQDALNFFNIFFASTLSMGSDFDMNHFEEKLIRVFKIFLNGLKEDM